jgi:hypothetical protein
MELVNRAKNYVEELRELMKGEQVTRIGVSPLGRLEPGTVMIDFIKREIKPEVWEKGRVTGNYYLETDEKYGDNSDNGHFDIEL